MKKLIALTTVAVAAASFAQAQDRDLLAGIDFGNGFDANYTDLPNGVANDGLTAAAFGSGSFTLGPNPGFVATIQPSGVDVAQGLTLFSDNRVAGVNDLFDVSGGSLLAEDAGFAGSADGGFFDFTVNTGGLYTDFQFGFAAAQTQAGTTTVDVSYDIGNGFVNAGQFQLSTLLSEGGEAASLDLQGVTASDITFRLGFTDIAVGTHFDNVQISGTAVPEPSTYAAIAGALALGFVAYRRRK